MTQPLRLRRAQLAEHGERPLLDPRARIGVERGVAAAAAPAPPARARAAGCVISVARGCRSVRHVCPHRGLSLRVRPMRSRHGMPCPSPASKRSRTGSAARSASSDWILVDQARIDAFADVTDDHQFIHVDPARGGEDAVRRHRRPRLPHPVAAEPDGRRRHAAPGKHQDGRSITASRRSASSPRSAPASGSAAASRSPRFEEKRAGQWQFVHEVTVEIEGEDKPALIADWIGYIFI